MNKPLPDPIPASTEEAHVRWAADYAAQIGEERPVHNRSGVPVKRFLSSGSCVAATVPRIKSANLRR